MLALRRHTAQHGVGEVEIAPAADPGLRIGRDVGDDESAELGGEPEPSTERPIRGGEPTLVGHAVARLASAEMEQPFAADEIAPVKDHLAIGQRIGRRQAIGCARTDDGEAQA